MTYGMHRQSSWTPFPISPVVLRCSRAWQERSWLFLHQSIQPRVQINIYSMTMSS